MGGARSRNQQKIQPPPGLPPNILLALIRPHMNAHLAPRPALPCSMPAALPQFAAPAPAFPAFAPAAPAFPSFAPAFAAPAPVCCPQPAPVCCQPPPPPPPVCQPAPPPQYQHVSTQVGYMPGCGGPAPAPIQFAPQVSAHFAPAPAPAPIQYAAPASAHFAPAPASAHFASAPVSSYFAQAPAPAPAPAASFYASSAQFARPSLPTPPQQIVVYRPANATKSAKYTVVV